MQVITFRDINAALEYIISGGMTINKFKEYERHLQELHAAFIDGKIILIDEIGLLD